MTEIEKLIKALQIFESINTNCYTHCEHDEMIIVGIPIEGVTPEQVKELDELGFFWSDSDQHFMSYKHGS